MAIATSAAIMGGAALAGAGLQIAQGAKQTRDAKRAMNNFERQTLENVYEDMPISLLGSNLRRQDASQTTADLTNAAQGAGIRGVFGALPRIQAGANDAARQNQLDVDNQVSRRNYAIAGDNARIQNIQENRDNQELAGIGQQLAVGQQNTWSGIQGAFNGIGMAASGLSGTIGGDGATAAAGGSQTPMMLPTIPAMQLGSGIPSMPGYMSPVSQASPIDDYYRRQEERRMYEEAAPKRF